MPDERERSGWEPDSDALAGALIWAVAGLGTFAVLGMAYVVIHFVVKFW